MLLRSPSNQAMSKRCGQLYSNSPEHWHCIIPLKSHKKFSRVQFLHWSAAKSNPPTFLNVPEPYIIFRVWSALTHDHASACGWHEILSDLKSQSKRSHPTRNQHLLRNLVHAIHFVQHVANPLPFIAPSSVNFDMVCNKSDTTGHTFFDSCFHWRCRFSAVENSLAGRGSAID